MTQNIVLIGMPGSGKSTVGRILAEELHKEFFDTDEVFTEEYKITPGDCITKEGEDAFRLKETEVVRKTAMTGGRVIATGGGVVCRRINTEFLKQNGFMVYLKRDLEHLSTQGRPLSNGTDAVKNLYEKRKSLYENSADCAVENREEDILFTVKEIKEAYENLDDKDLIDEYFKEKK